MFPILSLLKLSDEVPPLRRGPPRTSGGSLELIYARIHITKQVGAESVVTMSQSNHLSEAKEKQEFFTNLPSEIIVDILSRLPVRTIISCKCVCKPWLNLLETDEFVKSHLSKSVPGMALNGEESSKIFEFEDGFDLEHLEHHCITVTEYDSSGYGMMHSSVNGLLFSHHRLHYSKPGGLYIMNPITREVIQIPCPQDFACGILQRQIYGFGVGRLTGQYKLVRIFHNPTDDNEGTLSTAIPSSECQVYTLGTGLWRSITPDHMLEYKFLYPGVFLNGKIHWLVIDSNHSPLILCFDLEDELFSIFPSPPPLLFPVNKYTMGLYVRLGLSALKDCLCLNDCTSDETVIWLMKDYGVEKSWVKVHVIKRSKENIYPIKVFEDGVLAWGGSGAFYYSRKTKTTREIDAFRSGYRVGLILHTSSFLSLKSFVKEKVISF